MASNFLPLSLSCLLLALCFLPAQVRADDDLVELVAGLLENDDKDLRALAYEQIRKAAPGEEVTKQFAALLADVPPEVQAELLSALAGRKDPAAAPAVRELLSESKNAEVRLAAIKSLGPLGGVDDLAVLISLLSDGTGEEQQTANRSLVILPGDPVSAAIGGKLSSAPAPLTITLLEILTVRRARNTIPAILSQAEGENAEVRAAAMKSLGIIADAEDISGMIQGVLKAEPGRERDEAEKAIMFVCHRIKEESKQADPLLAAMETLPPADQTLLLSTLGRVGGPDALAVVEKAIADPKRHDAGLQALCNWPTAAVAFRLLELARTEEHEAHRRKAILSLIRVAPLPDDRSDGERLDLLRTAFVMCTDDADRKRVLDRAKAVRSLESLHYVERYFGDSTFNEQACLTAVELAHHSGLREANREEFHRVLDRVIELSGDKVVVDRANRYKKGETWVRPK